MRNSDIQSVGGAIAGQIAGLAARKVGAKTFGRQLARKTKGGAISTGFAYAGARVYSDVPWARAQAPHGWHINDYRQSLDWCGWPWEAEYENFLDKFNHLGVIYDTDYIRWVGPYASSGQIEGTIVFSKTWEDTPDQMQSFVKDPGIVNWPWRDGIPDQWGSPKESPSDWYDDDERYLEPWLGDNWAHVGSPKHPGRDEFAKGYPQLDVQPMNLGEHCIFKFDWDNPIWDFDEHGQQVAFVPLSIHPSVHAGRVWDKKDWHCSGMTTHIDGQWMEYKDGYTSWYIDCLANIEWSLGQVSREDWFKMLKQTGKIYNDSRRPEKQKGFWGGYQWIDRGWRHVFDRPENSYYCQLHNVPYIAYRHKLAVEVLTPKLDYGSVGTTTPTRTGGDSASDLGIVLEHIPNYQLGASEQYVYEMVPVVMKEGTPCAMMYNLMNMHNDPTVHSNTWDAKFWDNLPGLGGKNIGQNYKHTLGFKTYAGNIDLMCQQIFASQSAELESNPRSTQQSDNTSVSFSSNLNEASESFKLPGLESREWLDIKRTHVSVKEDDDVGDGYINMFTIPGNSEYFANNPYITTGYDWVSEEDSEWRYTSYQVDRNVDYWDGTTGPLDEDLIKQKLKLYTPPSISRNEVEVKLHSNQLNYDVSDADEYTLSTRIDYSNTMAKHISGKLKLDRIKLHSSTFCKSDTTVDIMLSANIASESDIIVRIFEADQEDISDSDEQTSVSSSGSGSGTQDKPTHLKQLRLSKRVGKILQKITFENIDANEVRFEAFLVVPDGKTIPADIKSTISSSNLVGCEFQKIDIFNDSSGFSVVNEFNKISVIKSDSTVVYEHPLTEQSSFLLSLTKGATGMSIYIDNQSVATFQDSDLQHSYSVGSKFITYMSKTKLVPNELVQLKDFIYSDDRSEFEKWLRLYQRGQKTTYTFITPCEIDLTNATPVHENGFRGWDSEPTTSRVLKRFNSDYAISGTEDGNEIKSIVEERAFTTLDNESQLQQVSSSVTEDGDSVIIDTDNSVITAGLAQNLAQAFGVISATQGYTDGFWAQLGWSTLGLGLFVWDLIDCLTLGTAAVTLGIIKWGIRFSKGGAKLYLKVGTKTLTRTTLRTAFSRAAMDSAQIEWAARWYKSISKFFKDPAQLAKFKSIHVHRVLPLPKFRTVDGQRLLVGWSWPYSSLTPSGAKNLFFNLFKHRAYQPTATTHGVAHATNLVDDVAHQMLGIKGGHWDACPDSALGDYLKALTTGLPQEQAELAMIEGLKKLHDTMLKSVGDPENIAVWTLSKVRARTDQGALNIDIGWISQIQKQLVHELPDGVSSSAVTPDMLKTKILEVFDELSDLAPQGKQLTKTERDEFAEAIDNVLKVAPDDLPVTELGDYSITNMTRMDGRQTASHLDNIKAGNNTNTNIDPDDLQHIGQVIFKSFLETQMNQVINYGLEPFARYSDILKNVGREGDLLRGGQGEMLYITLVKILQNPQIPSRMLVKEGKLIEKNAETIISKFNQVTESGLIQTGGEVGEDALPLTTTKYTPHEQVGGQIAKQSTKAGDGLLPRTMATRKMIKEMTEELDDIVLQYEKMGNIFAFLKTNLGKNIMNERSLWDDAFKTDGAPDLAKIFGPEIKTGMIPTSIDDMVKRNFPIFKSIYGMADGAQKDQIIADILKGIDDHLIELNLIRDGLVPQMRKGKSKITASVQTLIEDGKIIIAAKRATLPSKSNADVIGKMFSDADTLDKVARGAWDEIEDADELLDFAAAVADAGLPQWADGGQIVAALGASGVDLLRPAAQQHKFGFGANREVGKVFLQMLARTSRGLSDEFGRGADALWQPSAFDEVTESIMQSSRGLDGAAVHNSTAAGILTRAVGGDQRAMGVLIHQAWGAAQHARKNIDGHMCKKSEITIKPGDELWEELAGRMDFESGAGLSKQQWQKRGVYINELGDGKGSLQLIVDHGFGPNVKYVQVHPDKVVDGVVVEASKNPTLYKVPEKEVEKAVKNWMKGEHSLVDPEDSFKLLDDAAADGKIADYNQVVNLFKRYSPHIADNVTATELNSITEAMQGAQSIFRDSGIAITIKGDAGGGKRVLTTLPVIPTNPRGLELVADGYNHARTLLETFMTSNVMTQKMMRETLERLAKNSPNASKRPPGFLITTAGADSAKRSGILRAIRGTMEGAGNILKHMSSKRHWPHAMPVVGGVAGIAYAFDNHAKNATKHISYTTAIGDILADAENDQGTLKTYQYYHYYNNTTTTGLGADGFVEIRRSDAYVPTNSEDKGLSQPGEIVRYHYDQEMAMIGIQLAGLEDSPVQNLIDNDEEYACISKKQYDDAQNDDKDAYEWRRRCHGELVGLVADPSSLNFDSSKSHQTAETDANGKTWTALYEPYKVYVHSYGTTPHTRIEHNRYWKAPGGEIYDKRPDFLD